MVEFSMYQMNDSIFEKILLIGDTNVGKTSLINNLKDLSDTDQINKTAIISTTITTLTFANNKQLNFQFIEINPINFDMNLQHSLLYNSKIALMIIDQTNHSTFISISQLLSVLQSIRLKIILIFTKSDLESNIDTNQANKFFLELNTTQMEKIFISNLTKNNIDQLKKMIFDVYCSPDMILFQNLMSISHEKKHHIWLQIMLLGDSQVGKTSLFEQFFHKEFNQVVTTTIGIHDAFFYLKIQQAYIKVTLWDTAGQEKLRSIPLSYYQKADGIIIIYDVTNDKSFESIERWSKDINEKSSDKIVKYLIGNKVDLVSERMIDYNQAKSFAKKNDMSYNEMSCKLNLNVSNVVYNLIYDIYTTFKSRPNFKSLISQNSSKPSANCCTP